MTILTIGQQVNMIDDTQSTEQFRTSHKPVDAWVFRSPRYQKKLRVVIPSRGVKIDFGQRGASDFTRHKDAARMLRYLRRHAARIGLKLESLSRDKRLNPAKRNTFDRSLYKKTIEQALSIGTGRREHWRDSRTRGFWSRWLLWSLPSRTKAIRLIEKRFNLRIYQSRPS